jgi:hypothetical protein
MEAGPRRCRRGTRRRGCGWTHRGGWSGTAGRAGLRATGEGEVCGQQHGDPVADAAPGDVLRDASDPASVSRKAMWPRLIRSAGTRSSAKSMPTLLEVVTWDKQLNSTGASAPSSQARNAAMARRSLVCTTAWLSSPLVCGWWCPVVAGVPTRPIRGGRQAPGAAGADGSGSPCPHPRRWVGRPSAVGEAAAVDDGAVVPRVGQVGDAGERVGAEQQGVGGGTDGHGSHGVVLADPFRRAAGDALFTATPAGSPT